MAKKKHDYTSLPWSNILRRVWHFRHPGEPETDFWKRAGVDKHKRSKWYNHVNPSPSIETVNTIVNSLKLDPERDQQRILWLTYGDEPFTPLPVPISPWRRLNPKEFVEEFVSAAEHVYHQRKDMETEDILTTLAQGFQISRRRAALTWQPSTENNVGSALAIFSGDSESALAEMLKQIQHLRDDFAYYEKSAVLVWLVKHLGTIQARGTEYIEAQAGYRHFFDPGLWDRIGKRVATAVCEDIGPRIKEGTENLTELLDAAISKEFETVVHELFPDGEFTPGPGLVWTEEPTSVDESSDPTMYVSKLVMKPGVGDQPAKMIRQVETRYSFKREWLGSIAAGEASVCLVELDDQSMEKTLGKGDLVLIDTQRTQPVDNKIFVVRDGNSLKVRRIRITTRGTFLVSDNQVQKKNGTYLYPTKRFGDTMDIVGQVVWSARTFL